jgi:ABC-type uncharacterized transport system permease subunit
MPPKEARNPPKNPSWELRTPSLVFRILDFVGDVLAGAGTLIFVLVGLFGVMLRLDDYMRWTWNWALILSGSATMAAVGVLIRRYANQSN